MSAANISVTWYADRKRAAVTTEDCRKWWLAPSPTGGYAAVCDEDGDVVTGGTAVEVLGGLLGEQAAAYGGVR